MRMIETLVLGTGQVKAMLRYLWEKMGRELGRTRELPTVMEV